MTHAACFWLRELDERWGLGAFIRGSPAGRPARHVATTPRPVATAYLQPGEMGSHWVLFSMSKSESVFAREETSLCERESQTRGRSPTGGSPRVNSQIIREYSMLRANWVRTVAHYLRKDFVVAEHKRSHMSAKTVSPSM